MKHALTLCALLLAAPAFAQHVDCDQVINPFHPCHRWVDNSGGGMAQAARGESNNPGGLTGGGPVGGPAAGNPGTSPGKGGHKGHGGKQGHSKGKAK